MIPMGEKTRIVFTGDIAFSQCFQDGWKNKTSLDTEVRDYLREADHAVANLESPLTDGEIVSDRPLNHASNPGAGKFLAGCNMKIWSIANNHIMDCDIKGLEDTIRIAKENNCQTIGAGSSLDEAIKPVILGETVKVGVLSVASATWKYLMAGDNIPGAVTWDKISRLRNVISELRKETDWIVVVAHGGDEYCDIALPHMREKYHDLLELGADIVIGHHPHVVQNYEQVGKKMVFYSLGNFIFDTENQRDFAHTDNGILLGINFDKDKFSFDYLPIHIDRVQQVVRTGNVPVVFRVIEKTEYSKLWPFEAKLFYPVDLKKRKKQSARLRSANWFVFLGHEVLVCRHERYRTIQAGRILSMAGNWKTSELKDVCDYLVEQVNWHCQVEE